MKETITASDMIFKLNHGFLFHFLQHEGPSDSSNEFGISEIRSQQPGSRGSHSEFLRVKKKNEKDSTYEKMEGFPNERAVTVKWTKMTKSNGNAKQCVIEEEASVNRAGSGIVFAFHEN